MGQPAGGVQAKPRIDEGRVLPSRPPAVVVGTMLPAARRPGLRRAVASALDDRRLFILLPFAAIAGLVASISGSAQPEPLVLLIVALLLVASLPLALRATGTARLLALAMVFWGGYGLLAIHGALFGTAMLARPAYGTYEAHVDEVLTADDSQRRIIVSAITPLERARPLPIRRARLFVRGQADIRPGDTIRAPIRFYAVPGPVLPGSFDTQFHAYFDGIGAYGSTTGDTQVVSRGDPASPVRVIDGIRSAISERIDAVLPQPAAGIARALITGDQSVVTVDAREVMATAGLAHVLSVSGLHLTLVAGGVFVALRILLSLSETVARHLSVKRVAAGIGMLAALFYFAISGGNVAAVRATVMIMLVFGAVIAGRRALTMRNVAIAALLVLLTDPSSIFRPSFQLSFAAVIALIGAWELVRHREGKDRSLLAQFSGYFVGIAATSLVAGAATLLFSIYHFQQTSPLGVLGNLLSLPLVGFIMMPAGVFASLAMPLGMEAPFLAVMGWSIDRMLDLGAWVAGLSRGIDASPLLLPSALLFGLAALAWFAFLKTWHRLIGPALLAPTVVVFALDRPPDVLIADTTQAVAIRLEQGLGVVAGRPESFAVAVWRETYTEPMAKAEVGCDGIACIAHSPRGFTAAIIRDPAGFFEECGVDLMIARRPAPAACTAGTIIDSRALAAGGVHWLAWDSQAKSFEIRRAIPDRARPWRAPL